MTPNSPDNIIYDTVQKIVQNTLDNTTDMKQTQLKILNTGGINDMHIEIDGKLLRNVTSIDIAASVDNPTTVKIEMLLPDVELLSNTLNI